MTSLDTEKPAAPVNAAERALLRRIYEVLLLSRAVEERFWVLSRQGVASFVLTPRGHDVAQIASAAAIRRGHDSVWPYYRDMALALALGLTPFELFAGSLGRDCDPHSGSRQLTLHISSPRLRIGSVSSEIAAHLPHAVGAAYASRVLGDDRVAVAWFGDGASSEGATHEAMNLAGIHQLPVVFFCENNDIAISVPHHLQMPIASLAERGPAYGMPGVRVDGTDALAVYRATRTAVARARAGLGPSIVDAHVPRITSHSSQDDDQYRTPQEKAAAEARDPLPKLRAELLEFGLLAPGEEAQLQQAARARALEEADRALASPEPAPARARRWLYAGDPPHPELARLEAEGIGVGPFDDLDLPS
ncbi:MAG: thiamine pyrophosphate-dependent dehydrogenase E1 component subunit alpha [Chloroflexi bacterium]|nr:thiamine pyrophosphate-dependent dehydrogenase E1 component subunit alpha [Chloroflexota bacterium]